jgi:hypothetical protein
LHNVSISETFFVEWEAFLKRLFVQVPFQMQNSS